MFFIIMPDGLAIKTFTLSPLPPNSVLIVYRFEFECMTQKPFQIFSKNKTDYLHSDKLSNCISCSLASTCLSKYYVKKRGRQKKKKKIFHRRNCSLITNRTPLSQELKRRAIYTTFPDHFALKYGVGRTN